VVIAEIARIQGTRVNISCLGWLEPVSVPHLEFLFAKERAEVLVPKDWRIHMRRIEMMMESFDLDWSIKYARGKAQVIFERRHPEWAAIYGDPKLKVDPDLDKNELVQLFLEFERSQRQTLDSIEHLADFYGSMHLTEQMLPQMDIKSIPRPVLFQIQDLIVKPHFMPDRTRNLVARLFLSSVGRFGPLGTSVLRFSPDWPCKYLSLVQTSCL
jgi:hypothetical protein